jgi:hypothetical protein
MAQKPHARSQPSATLTYAHGSADAGRVRFSRSRAGTGGDEPAGRRPRVTGTPNPATASTSGRASASSSP